MSTKILFGILLTLIPVLNSSAVFSPEFESRLNRYIEASMKCHHIPGMTLSVVQDENVWTKGYGKANIHMDMEVDPYTKFDIGSITKSFTATLLGILLSEQGKSWSAKVTEILGSEYEFTDPYRTRELTLRDLLSHRTGLARLDFGLDPVFPKSWNRSSFCKRLKYLPEERPIRDRLIYNNYMFMMLGHVAEVLGQDTWENLMVAKVLQPLGMTNTSFLHSPNDVMQHNVAKPYMYIDDEFLNGTLEIYDLHPWEPAGAILSNAADMSKWIKFHLSLGKSESGVQILNKRMMEDMHQVTTASFSPKVKPKYPADDVRIGYGYAWYISEYRGYKKVWHSGGIGSYRSMLWTFPDINSGIFVSVNGPRFGAYDYYHRLVSLYFIADHLLNLDPWLNESTACSYPEPWGTLSQPKLPDPRTLVVNVQNTADLEGLYASPLFPDIEISSNSSQLWMKSNILRGILQPTRTPDRFLYEVVYPLEYSLRGNSTSDFFNVTFNRDNVSYAVNALTLHLEVDLKYDKHMHLTPLNISPQLIVSYILIFTTTIFQFFL